MKWSKYNILFYSKTASVNLAYNILTGTLIELEEDLYNKVSKYSKDPSKKEFDSDEISFFKEHKFIVDSDQDELNKIRLNLLRSRFSKKVLKLTIAPTYHCNFNCTYCFEENRPPVYMKEEVETSIIEYIKNSKESEVISICWYGGEPLMAKPIINSITNKIISLGKPFDATLITNGYLLDSDFIKKIESLQITSLQITIDGNRQTHNSYRPHILERDSFSRIVNNVRELSKQAPPNIKISIRVNIDKNNSSEFADVYKLIKSIDPNINIYPAFIFRNVQDEQCFINNKDRFDFLQNLYWNQGIYIDNIVPQINLTSCMMRSEGDLLIGPQGELYKCWEHLGAKDKCIGNILNKDKIIDNIEFLSRCMLCADYFEDPICLQCKYFPICNGGCSNHRIKNHSKDRSLNTSTCSVLKGNMEKALEIKYINANRNNL